MRAVITRAEIRRISLIEIRTKSRQDQIDRTEMKNPGIGKTVLRRIARTGGRIGKEPERIVRKAKREAMAVRRAETLRAKSGIEEIIGIKTEEKGRVSRRKLTGRRAETRVKTKTETKAEIRDKGFTDMVVGRNRTRKGTREIKREAF